MNRRPRLLATAAVGATAALLLTACGGGDDASKGNDKIAGADTGESASPSPSANGSAAPGRPKIELPSDLTYTFEWPKTGDKEKDAVLADSEQFIKAVDMAIAEQEPLEQGVSLLLRRYGRRGK